MHQWGWVAVEYRIGKAYFMVSFVDRASFQFVYMNDPDDDDRLG